MPKLTYPESKEIRFAETVHDVSIIDHYRWLEGDDEGKMTEEVANWTDKQNNFTRSILDNLPGRSDLEARIKPLMEIDTVGIPEIAGSRIFFSKREGTQNQPSFYYRDEIWGEDKLLLDPNELDKSGLLAIAWKSPSQDGSLLAYGSYLAGDENSTLKIIDVETKQVLPDVITGKVGGVSWLPDNTGFIYSRLADITNPYSRQTCFHIIGEDPKDDKIIDEQLKEGPLATTWGPYAFLSKDAKWIFLGYHTSTRSNDLWIADFEKWRKTGELDRLEIAKDFEGNTHADIYNNKLYILTNIEAPNSCIYTANLDRPGKDNWQIFIPEKTDAVIEYFEFSKNNIIVSYQKNASGNIKVFDFEGNKVMELPLPGIGNTHFTSHKNTNKIFFGFTSFNYPATLYLYDLETKERKKWNQIKVGFDPESVEVSQEWFTSTDGIKVSMFIVNKKGMKLNGTNPFLMYGYGGFGISMTPSFSPIKSTWFEDGGGYALVNLRGGSEYGDSWHKDGMRENKERVFEDFESAGEWLIENKYTDTEHLAIMGRSNGGLLMGAAVTRRPDLFKAVVCGVPLLDMIRFHKFLMAKFWVPEYGCSDDPEQFKWLMSYSPYHNIKENYKYPSVFFSTGENDTRVHPMHARKMTAAMQKASISDIEKSPIILWVDREAGHGQGKPLNLRVREEVDKWLYLRWQLGMLKK